MSAAATILLDTSTAVYYNDLAARARDVYLAKLWNGRYLNYDSSCSYHHDSIMADMLAGQWYTHACALPPVLSPQVAFSCLSTIYQHNVVDFGQGKLIGAVNGMRPPVEYDTKVGKKDVFTHTAGTAVTEATSTGSEEPNSSTALTGRGALSIPPVSAPIVPVPNRDRPTAQVDNTCMQSREVWTGTTYALAAAMIQEARYCNSSVKNSSAVSLLGRNTTVVMDLSSGVDSPADLSDTNKEQGTEKDTQKVELVVRKGGPEAAVPTVAPTPLSRELIHPQSPHGALLVQTQTATAATQLTPVQRALLLEMAQATAQGVHDGGWQEFGYWFATPEGWERNGNYRSLGYMRALGIWAMQFAKEQR